LANESLVINVMFEFEGDPGGLCWTIRLRHDIQEFRPGCSGSWPEPFRTATLATNGATRQHSVSPREYESRFANGLRRSVNRKVM
jgi:hypothetical protein